MNTRKTIGVHPPPRFRARRPLFEALSRQFPVDFRECDGLDLEGIAALVLLDGDLETASRAAKAGVRSFAALSGGATVGSGPKNVHFTDSPCLPACLRSQNLEDSDVTPMHALDPVPGGELLASDRGHPLWSIRREAHATIHLVSLPPPDLAAHENLYEHLQGRRFIRLLPLFHFLRDVTQDIDWVAPPLRAVVQFDDLNLHSFSYGCVDYRTLLQHLRQHGYHISIATIPLDARRSDARTVALFRENTAHLSLLIHGNNHTAFELAQACSESDRLALLAQALRRIERLERHTRLEVSRIMVPPHGACSQEMTQSMLQLGYEAACMYRESMLSHCGRIWPATVGLGVVDLLDGGFPVIPRFKIAGWKHDAVIAAFLRQPIIPAAHHGDLAEGLELLTQVADHINRLDKVHWMDMQELARSNFLSRTDGSSYNVRMCARRIHVDVPGGMRDLCIERPWMTEDGEHEGFRCMQRGHELARGTTGRFIGPIPVQPVGTIEIESLPVRALAHSQIPAPRARLWPVGRRILTHFRDRLYPISPSLFSFATSLRKAPGDRR